MAATSPILSQIDAVGLLVVVRVIGIRHAARTISAFVVGLDRAPRIDRRADPVAIVRRLPQGTGLSTHDNDIDLIRIYDRELSTHRPGALFHEA